LAGERRLTASSAKGETAARIRRLGNSPLPPHGRHAKSEFRFESARSVVLTRKQSTSTTEVPKLSARREFNPTDAGFSLNADEDTLREIEEIQDEAVKAAQETRKFAWR
jgi:hypothetical protein